MEGKGLETHFLLWFPILTIVSFQGRAPKILFDNSPVILVPSVSLTLLASSLLLVT
jgi:hypothetical protein